MSAPLTPTLKAVQIRCSDGFRFVAWCPWCETLHHHGGEAGDRVSHCVRGMIRSPAYDPASPLSGYTVEVSREALKDIDAVPSAPFAKRHPFWRRLKARGERFRTSLASTILGDSLVRGRRPQVSPNGQWRWPLPPPGAPYRGLDLLKLAAHLYGIPEGVVAVRIIEATTGASLDRDAALAVQQAVDQWVARGAPRRDGEGLSP